MRAESGQPPRARPGPRRPQGAPTGPEEVRRAVLDSAAELFATNGVGSVSLRDIAAHANVQVALIRRYIGTRSELLDAVMADLADQVAQNVVDRPLQQQSFDADSALGRWSILLVHFATTGRDLSFIADPNPVTALARVADGAYEIGDLASRVRGAQILASALGWRLLEPYLLAAGDLQEVPVQDLHDALTEVHRRIGAMPWEPPPASRPPKKRG